MSYTIEKGIPIPRGAGSKSEFADLLRSMDIGDSILVTNKNRTSVSSSLANVQRDGKLKYATRTVEGGFRIWRIA